MTQLHINRRLDPGERFFWLLDRVSCMNFVVFAEIAGIVDSEHLRAGLQQAQQAHPLLRVQINANPDGALEFLPADTPLVLQPVAVEQANWRQAIESELSRPFSLEDAPLMRCLLLQFTDQARSVLALTFHHSIADGRSGTSLLREILAYLAQPQRTSHFNTGAAHPPMHATFPAQYDWRRQPQAAMDLLALKKTEFKRHGRPDALPWLDQLQTQRVPRFLNITLDVAQTSQLIGQCKTRGVTVHGALGAAQLLAKARSSDTENPESPMTLGLASPVDMRPYLAQAIPTSGLGLYITLAFSNYRVGNSETFWDLAREVGDDIKRQLGRGDGHLFFTQINPDVFPPSSEGIDAFAKIMLATPQSSMISNIGKVDPVHAALKVDAISFVLCPMPYQVMFSAVSTYNNKLIINMAYDAAKMTPRHAEQLKQWVRQDLLSAAQC